jgi:hypothetical protein
VIAAWSRGIVELSTVVDLFFGRNFGLRSLEHSIALKFCALQKVLLVVKFLTTMITHKKALFVQFSWPKLTVQDNVQKLLTIGYV